MGEQQSLSSHLYSSQVFEESCRVDPYSKFSFGCLRIMILLKCSFAYLISRRFCCIVEQIAVHAFKPDLWDLSSVWKSASGSRKAELHTLLRQLLPAKKMLTQNEESTMVRGRVSNTDSGLRIGSKLIFGQK